MIKGKKIILGVCGSIAAYKAAIFVRLLIKAEAGVRVIMTENSKSFISPLTLATLSKQKVRSSLYYPATGEWENHVALGEWGDAMVIMPTSANTLAKMASGAADNLLLTTYLSARCPVFFAPAMDHDMHEHPTTLHNIKTLTGFGNIHVKSNEGELASGLSGIGRLAEPEELIQVLINHFSRSLDLAGKKVLITSGPTHEKIDAVRYIANNSSGKMGAYLAQECANRGASVLFVSGPSRFMPVKSPNIKVFNVRSAVQMFDSSAQLFPKADISIFAAAVADYRVKGENPGKLKRNGSSRRIELEENPDIAASLSTKKEQHQITVGFALETENEAGNALIKLKQKNLDMIILNLLNNAESGFGHDTNQIKIIKDGAKDLDFGVKPKSLVAVDILDAILGLEHA